MPVAVDHPETVINQRDAKPARCVLEISYSCNLRCVTCNIWRPHFRERRLPARLTKQQYLQLHDILKGAGVRQITYVGGEPFMNRDLFTFIHRAYELGLMTAVVTNGTLLDNDRIQRIFSSNLHTLIVSLDGPEQVHDTIRAGNGLFGLVTHHVRTIQREKKRAGRKYPRINVYVTVSRLNHTSLFDMLDVLQRLDVNTVRFQQVSVISKDVSSATQSCLGWDAVGCHSYAVSKRLRLPVHAKDTIRAMIARATLWSRRTGIQVLWEKQLFNSANHSPCEFVRKSMVINPRGEVVPCPMLPRLTLGNIVSRPFHTIWLNQQHREFLAILEKEKVLPVCRQCCVEKRS